MKYYKVLSEDMCHHGFQYKEGLNVDPMPFENRECCYGGLFFSDAKHILEFSGFGNLIAEVEIPENETVVPIFNKKYKAHSIIIKNIQPLFTIETYKMLKKELEKTNETFELELTSADILLENVFDEELIHEILKELSILVDKGKILPSSVLRRSVQKNNFDIFKKLCNSKDKHGRNNAFYYDLLHDLVCCNRFEMLKWLNEEYHYLEDNKFLLNRVFNESISFGHEDIAKYLLQNGATASVSTVHAAIRAGENQYFEKYYNEISTNGTLFLDELLEISIKYENLYAYEFLIKEIQNLPEKRAEKTFSKVITYYEQYFSKISLEMWKTILNKDLIDIHYNNDAFLLNTVLKANENKLYYPILHLLLEHGANVKARNGWIKRKANPEVLAIISKKN